MATPEGDGASASAPFKPRLKLNVSRSSSFVGDASTVVASPLAATTPGDGAPRKVKLRISSLQPSTPADKAPSAVKTKAGRQPKPTQKLVESKKRPRIDDDDDELPLARRAGGGAATPKAKIKIRQTSKSGPTQVVLKPRGRPPHHPPGDGYDSEASDREIDPAIEEQFVLRMLPGEHCDYVRWCMENGKMGVPRSQGGADILLKFFEEESRRAVVTVKGQPFAAAMVDLPTITETMKTWDKKSLIKSADVCQMLLVFQKAKDDHEAKTAPLPPPIDPNFKWPHGLTPPMHDCVNRRFAKTISRKEIEDKEAEVERLLEDDKAVSTRWEWVEERHHEAEDEDVADEDAEGEVDDGMSFFGTAPSQAPGDVEDNDLEADLEAAFADEIMAGTPATGIDAPTPMTAQAGTPAAALQESIENDDESEEDDDDDDDLDEDQRAQRDEVQGVRDIIKDLEAQLKLRMKDLGKIGNKILATRVENQIKQLRSEIELKKSSIGMEQDD